MLQPRFYTVVGHQGMPLEGDTIGIQRRAGVPGSPVTASPERERIADQVTAITARHGEHFPAAVEALVEMLKSEGWHLVLHVEEEGLHYWSIEEGAHPAAHEGDGQG